MNPNSHSREQNQNNHSRNKVAQASDYNPFCHCLGYEDSLFVFLINLTVFMLYIFFNNKIKVSEENNKKEPFFFT